ncbi:iron ABC transporter permease [Micromonospora musae]|uniref:Iron ABC transporter permease n=1 Tax=Micromonospora musae TaxID=1894970 RepID=A0A3A9Y993_9ACTN|nr:iron ABC transporter permease [Micromonospora musae]
MARAAEIRRILRLKSAPVRGREPATSGAEATVPRRFVLRLLVVCGVLACGLAVAVVAGVALGPVRIPPLEVVTALADDLGLPLPGDEAGGQHTTVINYIRLPRVLVGALVGAALGIAGATMQAVFRNPLAEPGVIGVSSGAALGAVAAIYFGWTALTPWMLPATAFVGAVAAMGFVFMVAALRRDRGPVTLLLVGIAVSAFFGALISVMVATAANDEELRGIVFWLQGGLGARTWQHVQLAAAPVVAGCLLLTVFGRDLNVLLLGDDGARAAGLDVARQRVVILGLTSLLTGAAVAVSGVIGFVGLVVPHALRLVIGPDNRILLPASALGGAAFLVLADLIARVAFSPTSLQVGIVTALFGAPVFLALVLRRRGTTGGLR